jgi:hypothetical protein
MTRPSKRNTPGSACQELEFGAPSERSSERARLVDLELLPRERSAHVHLMARVPDVREDDVAGVGREGGPAAVGG